MTSSAESIAAIESAAVRFREDFAKVRREIAKAVVGHRAVVDGVLTGLDPAVRGLLERRHGWADERPHSVAELAAAEGVPFTRIAARLRQAHRMLWRPRGRRM